MKHCKCKEDYAWKFSIYTCELNKECELDEYLENHIYYLENVFDKIVMTFNDIVNETKIVSNFIDKQNYCTIYTNLVIMWFLLSRVIVIKFHYHIKHQITCQQYYIV